MQALVPMNSLQNNQVRQTANDPLIFDIHALSRGLPRSSQVCARLQLTKSDHPHPTARLETNWTMTVMHTAQQDHAVRLHTTAFRADRAGKHSWLEPSSQVWRASEVKTLHKEPKPNPLRRDHHIKQKKELKLT